MIFKKKIILIAIIVILIICCCNGCHEYLFDFNKNQEPTPQITMEEFRPIKPIIEKPVKIEDIVIENHKKRERINELDKKIANLEKEIERKNETFSKIASETNEIKKEATDIKSIIDSPEPLPEPSTASIEPSLQKIVDRSENIVILSTSQPYDVEPSPEPVDIEPSPLPIENIEETGKGLNYHKILLGAIFGVCGLFLLIRYVFSREQ